MVEIKYPNGDAPELAYRGRNGYGKQTGIALVNLHRDGRTVLRLQPITSRDEISDACSMEVPVEAAGLLVDAIQSCLGP